jgi:hypothetical protein
VHKKIDGVRAALSQRKTHETTPANFATLGLCDGGGGETQKRGYRAAGWSKYLRHPGIPDAEVGGDARVCAWETSQIDKNLETAGLGITTTGAALSPGTCSLDSAGCRRLAITGADAVFVCCRQHLRFFVLRSWP